VVSSIMPMGGAAGLRALGVNAPLSAALRVSLIPSFERGQTQNWLV
jgi:hypothetical protein